MKCLPSLFAALAFLPLALTAAETSPREQFNDAVAAFKKSATEDNARKLAEVSKQLDPQPAVPEDAEFHALKGAAFVKQAGDAAAFAMAAGEFSAAISAAPWISEYHYNLAVCEKSAGHFEAAQTALKFAQIFARDDKERHDCLALRADLEAAKELAAAKENSAEARRSREREREREQQVAFLRGLDGGVWLLSDDEIWKQTVEIKGNQLYRVSVCKKYPDHRYDSSTPVATVTGQSFNVPRSGGFQLRDPAMGYTESNFADGTARISNDGNTISWPHVGAEHEVWKNYVTECRRIR